MGSVVDKVIKLGKFPHLAVDAALRLSKWTDTKTALDKLKSVEKIVVSQLGREDPKCVEIKRELALVLIKRREHDQALEYLSEVQLLERQVFGPQSVQLARTLKALGTVYMLKGGKHFAEAQDCLATALAIFDANATPSNVIQDIKHKIHSIDQHRRSEGKF